nr:MAG TPA: hypothetical protein [Caudoviricetes sp.]
MYRLNRIVSTCSIELILYLTILYYLIQHISLCSLNYVR